MTKSASFATALLLTASLALVGCSQDSDSPNTDAEPTASGSSTGTPGDQGTSAGNGTEFTPAKARWGKCKDKELGKLKCATLKVPMDYADPAGEQISLALTLRKHKGSTSRGVLLTNPGGPGSPGLQMPEWVGGFDKVMDSYDIVGMDPRGIGASKPAVTCPIPKSAEQSKPKDEIPADDAAIAAWEKWSADFATACGDAPSANLLAHITTTNVAEDLDSIRKAMGAEKVSYWGNSYGTRLGQTYATLHPDRVDKMFLDSVVSPTLAWSDLGFAQAVTLEENLPRFYDYLAKNNKTLKLGTDPKAIAAKVKKAFDQLGAKPMDDGKFGQDELAASLRQATYGVSFYPAIATGLSLLINQQTSLGFEGASDQADGREAAFLSVFCHESQWPDAAGYLDEAKATAAKAPILTWGEAWLAAPCITWPVERVEPITIDGSQLQAPVLMYSETYDGATPLSGALESRTLFPTSALIEGQGGVSHSGATVSTGCGREAMVAFFTDGTLPQRKDGDTPDLSCPTGEPGPVPPLPSKKDLEQLQNN